MKSDRPDGAPSHRFLRTLGAVLGALAVTAAVVARSARRTERAHPPAGRFVEANGVKLHYIERGTGSPVVLLHGNGVSALDWEVSGVLGVLAASHRVIAFDRPGFGYSARPRGRAWTPVQQAELIHAALDILGVVRPIVVAHSWATLVALALALDFPADVARLVLVSGYYFPSLRLDPVLQAPSATPVLGDVLRWTVAPVLGRLMTPLALRHLFAPAPVPERFARFPLSMSRRPGQLRASAQEAVLMVPAAMQLQHRYGNLGVPVTIIAGAGDAVASASAQSNRLSHILMQSDADIVADAGHMVHYAVPERVIAAAREGTAALVPTVR
ncbi:MAG: alpha/beta fold hydrolase [Candidatus Baltobacteraceae bacterium]